MNIPKIEVGTIVRYYPTRVTQKVTKIYETFLVTDEGRKWVHDGDQWVRLFRGIPCHLVAVIEGPFIIKPDPKCRYCHGSGTIYDTVDYGSTTTQLPSTCECVEDQIPEGYEDLEVELDLSGQAPEAEVDLRLNDEPPSVIN